MRASFVSLMTQVFLLACMSAAQATPITYQFGWIASGTQTSTVTRSFTDAPFVLTFVGDTANVGPAGNGGHAIEGLTGKLSGPLGATSTLLDQFVGIQAPGVGQSIGYGSVSDYVFTLDLGLKDPSAFPDFSTYDLTSAFGPMSGSAVDGGFPMPPLFPGLGLSFDINTAKSFSFEASKGNGTEIAYQFGWTASGTQTSTVTTSFTDAPFVLTFVGDTANVGPAGNGGHAIEGLTGKLSGPLGATSTLLDQFVGIQAPGVGQSIGYGSASDYVFALDLSLNDPSAFPDFSTYDLTSAFGPMSGPAVDGGFPILPLFPELGLSFDIDSVKNLSFQATTSTDVPEPATITVAALALSALALLRRRK